MSMNTFNLPSGVTLRDIDPPTTIPEGWHECAECLRLTTSQGPVCFTCQAARDRAQDAVDALAAEWQKGTQ